MPPETETLYNIAEIELVYKTNYNIIDRPRITSAFEAAEILRHCWDENKIELLEQFKALLLNKNQRLLGVYDAASGGVSGVTVEPKHILLAAIKANASCIIMAHNHPSGNLEPSKPDIALTERMKQGGLLLGVNVCDHIILTKQSYFSFGDSGIMP